MTRVVSDVEYKESRLGSPLFLTICIRASYRFLDFRPQRSGVQGSKTNNLIVVGSVKETA